jgi:hypothetical protein
MKSLFCSQFWRFQPRKAGSIALGLRQNIMVVGGCGKERTEEGERQRQRQRERERDERERKLGKISSSLAHPQ